MTNDRAKEVLKAWNLNHSDEFTVHEFDEAFRMAIKALEQEPCEDVVSRQEVLSEVKSGMIRTIDGENWKRVNDNVRDIQALPPVTPQEPKIGHWIYENFNWRCSECNEPPKTMGYVGTADFMTEHFKFCNHCGSRMVEPQAESEG